MDNVVRGWGKLQRFGKQFGPYFLLEMVMPGGTLLALLLLLYRCKRADVERWMRWPMIAVTRILPAAAQADCGVQV